MITIDLQMCSYFLSGFFFLISIYFYRQSDYYKKIAEQLMSSVTYKFENDTEYLLYIISYKCQIYINSTFKTKIELNKNGLLKGELLTDAVNSIVLDVLNTLSPHYKNVLMKYFTKKSLNIYIAEIVMDTMIKLGTNINQEKIKTIYNFTTSSKDEKDNESKKPEIEFRKKDIEG